MSEVQAETAAPEVGGLDGLLEAISQDESGDTPEETQEPEAPQEAAEAPIEEASGEEKPSPQQAWEKRRAERVQLKEENKRLSEEQEVLRRQAAIGDAILKLLPKSTAAAELAPKPEAAREIPDFYENPPEYVDQRLAPVQQTVEQLLDEKIAATESELAAIENQQKVADLADTMRTDVAEWVEHTPQFNDQFSQYRQDYVARAMQFYGAQPQQAEASFWNDVAQAWAAAPSMNVHPCKILEGRMGFFYGGGQPQAQAPPQVQQPAQPQQAQPQYQQPDALSAAHAAGVAGNVGAQALPRPDLSVESLAAAGYDAQMIEERIAPNGVLDMDALWSLAEEAEKRGIPML